MRKYKKRKGGYKPQKSKSLVGQTFGSLAVQDVDHNVKRPGHYICLCECNNIVSVRADNLKRHNTVSCGCSRAKRSGVTRIMGTTFGNLTVIERKQTATPNHYRYVCRLPDESTVTVSRQTLYTRKYQKAT